MSKIEPTIRSSFFGLQAQTTNFPLGIEISHAKGVYLYQTNGKPLIDLISGISVSNVGHGNPEVLKAIISQAEKHLHTMVYGELIESAPALLAQALYATLPQHLDNIYFVNSGSEALEGALKLAKRFTQRPNIVSCFNAYHGSSIGALSVGGSAEFKSGYYPIVPGTRRINFGSEEELSAIDHTTAAIVIETIQGEAGVREASQSYWFALKKRCAETGTLLILDEIQAGVGRTGKFWAFQHYGICPDILVTAKGLGAGMPLGAFIAPKAIMQSLAENPILGHITTFGGHPVSCAAALAGLKIIQENNLLASIPAKVEAFISELQGLSSIKEIRAKGFLMAIEVDSFDTVKAVIDEAIENGILTDWFLFNNKSVRVAPPLTITEEELRAAGKILRSAILKFENN